MIHMNIYFDLTTAITPGMLLVGLLALRLWAWPNEAPRLHWRRDGP